MTLRTDIHRPSAIRPEEYQWIGFVYLGSGEKDVGELMMLAEERKRIRQHMETTGGRYSNHEHGGTCHICGAHALYLAVYYHQSSNSYIKTGEDCAQKMDFGDTEGFTPLRRAIRNALEAKAGKMKCQRILADADLSRAWEISQLLRNPNGASWEWNTLRDIVRNCVKYGNLSDKQLAFLKSLVDKIDNYADQQAEWEAKKAAERDAAEEVPEGRHVVTGEVLSTKYQESQYGEQLKMLVKDDRGFKIWGSVPSNLQLFVVLGEDPDYDIQRGLEKGDRVTFSANLKQSDDDSKFGFASRPTKAMHIPK